MNKQIQDFEKQCWSQHVDGVLIDGHLHFDTKKFAKLIVEQCLALTHNVIYECDEDDELQQAAGAAWVAITIADYFEIKE